MSEIVKRHIDAMSLSELPMTPALASLIASPFLSSFGKPSGSSDRASHDNRGQSGAGLALSPMAGITRAIIREAHSILPMMMELIKPLSRNDLDDKIETLMITLCGSVHNPLEGKARSIRKSMFIRVCEDMPATIWTRALFVEAGRRFEYMPSASQVFRLASDFASSDRSKVAIVQAISEKRIEPVAEVRKVTEEEKNAVRALLAQRESEMKAREEEERAIREWGQWMPEEAKGLRGDDLADFFSGAVENMTGLKREIMLRRIDTLRRAAQMARELSQ